MYKMLVGIPAMMIPNYANEKGLIIDKEFEESADPWCDFEFDYDMDEKKYYFVFETLLGFDNDSGCRDWIIDCMTLVTEYMISHNYDITKELSMYDVFTAGVNVNTKFDTIEDAYAFLKFVVFGFHGNGEFIGGKDDTK